MLGYLLAHITFFSRRHEEDEGGGRSYKPSLLPMLINALLMCIYLAFAVVGYTSKGSCNSLLSTFLILLLLYSILMTVFSFMFIWDKCNNSYKLIVFHSLGCVYLLTTIAGLVVIFSDSIQPGPPESCRVLSPWLYYCCLVVVVLNIVSALLFCPLSCLHLFFYVCGNMTCPQGAARASGNVEEFVVTCADFHPEFFLLGSIRHVV